MSPIGTITPEPENEAALAALVAMLPQGEMREFFAHAVSLLQSGRAVSFWAES